MSYYRPVRHEELVAWLSRKGYAETAEELAEELQKEFDVLFISSTAT